MAVQQLPKLSAGVRFPYPAPFFFLAMSRQRHSAAFFCGIRIMAVQQLPKLHVGVRFPYPAPFFFLAISRKNTASSVLRDSYNGSTAASQAARGGSIPLSRSILFSRYGSAKAQRRLFLRDSYNGSTTASQAARGGSIPLSRSIFFTRYITEIAQLRLFCGIRIMAVQQLPKLHVGVRFPYPAPKNCRPQTKERNGQNHEYAF